jgi:SulP family sulfate permease
MAAVGCLESLLTLQLLDGMVDDGTRGSAKKECLGQGSGNILSGLTGGIGGCALLGQSIINVQSGGGISRFSGMSMALFLAFGIVAAAPLLGSVPVASLVGVMLLVCQSTFSWSSLRLIRKIPKLDVFVIALVTIVTVQKDLAAAVLCGTIASALGFAYKQSTVLTATFEGDDKKKVYNLRGPLFFGSTTQFDSTFSPKTDPPDVVLDFRESRIMDHSAVDAIHSLSDKYAAMGKTMYLQGLCSDSTDLLLRYCQGRKSNPPFQMMGSEYDTINHGDAAVYKELPL